MFKIISKKFAYLGKDVYYFKNQHNNNILITGSSSRFGQALTKSLYSRYGLSNVIALDIKDTNILEGQVYKEDIRNKDKLRQIVEQHKINRIIHLAELDYRKSENDNRLAKEINIDAAYNMLDLATEFKTR